MTPRSVDLVVRNGTVVTSGGRFRAEVVVEGGQVALLGDMDGLGLVPVEVYDAGGCYVLPGVIDGHVHFREPGLEYKEDLHTGSRAAVMGSVTTVIDMPNTRPPTASGLLVAEKRQLAEAKACCDVALYELLSDDNLAELEPMALEGVAGYKCLLGETVGNLAAQDDGALLEALRITRRLPRRVGFHAENDAILQRAIAAVKSSGRSDVAAHAEARPAVAEAEAIQRVGLFAHHPGAPIHVFCLSSCEGREAASGWRARGVDMTTELTPHHAFLNTDYGAAPGSLLRINPPVRDPRHGPVLLTGLATGHIDLIATDHAPHTPEEKHHDDVWQPVSGFAGVETSASLSLTYAVDDGRLTLERYVRASSKAPARAWRLCPRNGASQVGSDADFTVVRLDAHGTIRAAQLQGNHPLSPYDGWAITGGPVSTIERGQIVMRDGELIGPLHGRLVRPVPGAPVSAPGGSAGSGPRDGSGPVVGGATMRPMAATAAPGHGQDDRR